MQTRIQATFNENYLDAPAVRAMFFEAMDADARVGRGWGNSATCVSFVLYGRFSEMSLFRFYRMLHRRDPFARVLVDGRLFTAQPSI
ncbi:hypothetical protein [Hymenobacter sp. CRA2]|uniref:hypothetical protein n=1 Tax=Hymenobacter sp. CRA2 TaxID=1955620 RepID=UPI00098F34AC|nr:hypothetical protein [Hymenobacter sp. CRA2]OON68786.1 hypothetical protein B0919_11405 [Hymenobacter sp. CRA2]